jgi:uncharacterized protein YjbI with pentapeptide repeats
VIDDCKCNGAAFPDSTFKGTAITNASFVYANLSESLLDGCEIVSTDLSKSFLSRLTLRRTKLRDCKLTNAELFRTSLKGMDLSDCEISGITLSDDLSELKGATVSYAQGIDLITMLGVKVK